MTLRSILYDKLGFAYKASAEPCACDEHRDTLKPNLKGIFVLFAVHCSCHIVVNNLVV